MEASKTFMSALFTNTPDMDLLLKYIDRPEPYPQGRKRVFTVSGQFRVHSSTVEWRFANQQKRFGI